MFYDYNLYTIEGADPTPWLTTFLNTEYIFLESQYIIIKKLLNTINLLKVSMILLAGNPDLKPYRLYLMMLFGLAQSF